jgi:hypothetical protein
MRNRKLQKPKNQPGKMYSLTGEKFQSRSQKANNKRVTPIIENSVTPSGGNSGTTNCILPFELLRISQGPGVEIEMRINGNNPINFDDLSRWIVEQLEDFQI